MNSPPPPPPLPMKASPPRPRRAAPAREVAGCEWAAGWPALRAAAALARVPAVAGAAWRAARPVAQRGPSCGPAAVATLLGLPLEAPLDAAIHAGYSRQGEMFSAQNMLSLVQRLAPPEVVAYLGTDNLDSDAVFNKIMNGASLLVPYDCDGDFSPCEKEGHKAHWALITGAAEADDGRWVIALHGKSSRPALWRAARLASSNRGLSAAGARGDPARYVLPAGGLAGAAGLAARHVVVRGLPPRTTMLDDDLLAT